jgi:hypothetical protein
MISDALSLTGELIIKLIRADGSEEITHVKNLVVTVGKTIVAERMLAAPAINAVSHVALGTGPNPATAADTTLMIELVGSRFALDTITRVGTKVTYAKQYGPGVGTGSLVEAGLFNAAVAGDMMARTTFSVINKGALDTIQVIWNVTVG